MKHRPRRGVSRARPPARRFGHGALGDAGHARVVVLVVEDHDDTGDMLVEYLLHHGACATRAADVAHALEILDVMEVDVIVTDHAMPGATGLDLVEYVRANPRIRDTGCIVISGHVPLDKVAIRAEALGATFVAKPLPLATLLDLVALAAVKPMSS